MAWAAWAAWAAGVNTRDSKEATGCLAAWALASSPTAAADPSVPIILLLQGQPVELVDTAGWIRRAKLGAYDESGGAVAAQTVEEGRSVMQFVHVVALVVDAVR